MLSDQTTGHLRLFPSISPLALLASFTCSFFKCILFFSWFRPLSSSRLLWNTSVSLMSCEYQRGSILESCRLPPNHCFLWAWLGATDANTPRSGWIPCPLKYTWELTVHPVEWCPLCNFWVSPGVLIRKMALWLYQMLCGLKQQTGGFYPQWAIVTFPCRFWHWCDTQMMINCRLPFSEQTFQCKKKRKTNKKNSRRWEKRNF